jgi:hypothetical protein
MVREMARVVRSGGQVVVTDAVEHDYGWTRIEQSDMWLGLSPEQVEDRFDNVRLIDDGTRRWVCNAAWLLGPRSGHSEYWRLRCVGLRSLV